MFLRWFQAGFNFSITYRIWKYSKYCCDQIYSCVNTVGDTILVVGKPWFSHEVGKDFRKRENGGDSSTGYNANYQWIRESGTAWIESAMNQKWLGRVERSNEGLTRTAFFDRGNWMIFCVKSHPVFLFWDQILEKCSLRNRFDRIRGEENRFWFSYPFHPVWKCQWACAKVDCGAVAFSAFGLFGG